VKQYFQPKTWMSALDTIDQEYPSHSFDKPKALRRTLITLAAVSISLLFLHYAKYTSSFYIFLSMIESTFNLPEDYFRQSLAQTQWHTLIEYAWWTSCHLLAFILIPVFVIKFLFKDAVANFGWRFYVASLKARARSQCHLDYVCALYDDSSTETLARSYRRYFIWFFPWHTRHAIAQYLGWRVSSCRYCTEYGYSGNDSNQWFADTVLALVLEPAGNVELNHQWW
jgi:hypothetical protein